MADVGVLGEVAADVALQCAGRGEVQFGIHTQRIQSGCQRRQVPQVAVAHAAVGVQAHFDDARVQPLVQKMPQPQQQPHQHAPIQARCGHQGECKGAQTDHRLGARGLPQGHEGARFDQAHHGGDHHRRQHRLRYMVQRGCQPQQHHQHHAGGHQRCPAGARTGIEVDGRA